jgi:hypothetical protein
MLNQRFRHHDIANVDVFIPASGDAGKDDVGNSELFHKVAAVMAAATLPIRDKTHTASISQSFPAVYSRMP